MKGNASKSCSKRIKLDQTNDSSTSPILTKSEQLKIGQWAIFKSDNAENVSGIRDYKIGLITGFRLFDTKCSKKGSNISQITFIINSDNNQAILKRRLELGFDTDSNEIYILGSFHTCNENGILISCENIHKFSLKKYFATVKNPKIRKDDNDDTFVYSLPCEYPDMIRLITELNEKICKHRTRSFN